MSPNGGNVCYSSVHVVQATVLDKSSKIDFVLPKDTFEYALNSATVRLLDVSIFIFSYNLHHIQSFPTLLFPTLFCKFFYETVNNG